MEVLNYGIKEDYIDYKNIIEKVNKGSIAEELGIEPRRYIIIY